jgi:hypothetical protein
MSETCRRDDEHEKCITDFSFKNLNIKDYLEDRGADEMIILRWLLKK